MLVDSEVLSGGHEPKRAVRAVPRGVPESRTSKMEDDV